MKKGPPLFALCFIRRILSPGALGRAAVLALMAASFFSGLTSSLLAQTTIGTDSIVGTGSDTVSDPTGSVIIGAS